MDLRRRCDMSDDIRSVSCTAAAAAAATALDGLCSPCKEPKCNLLSGPHMCAAIDRVVSSARATYRVLSLPCGMLSSSNKSVTNCHQSMGPFRSIHKEAYVLSTRLLRRSRYEACLRIKEKGEVPYCPFLCRLLFVLMHCARPQPDQQTRKSSQPQISEDGWYPGS